MAHPYHHALSSVKKWGGMVDDFIAVACLVRPEEGDHRRFSAPGAPSSCRGHLHGRDDLRPDPHALDRAHHTPTRWVGEQHVKEDLGCIPSFADWGEGHPARTLDGPVRADRGAGRSASRLARGRGELT